MDIKEKNENINPLMIRGLPMRIRKTSLVGEEW